MLNEETVSRRLRVVHKWMKGMIDGSFPASDQTFEKMEVLIGECVTGVEQLELETGTASVTVQLRRAGGNIVTLKAVLDGDNARRHA